MLIDLVIPTIGRPSLATLLASLAGSSGPLPRQIFIVDDRRPTEEPLALGAGGAVLRARLTLLRGRAAGPAAARNAGWRASDADWIAFLDDDVVVSETWLADLARDLVDAPADVAASQGRVEVPLPSDRRPTDWERNVAGLATARWITADCAYRRNELLAAGGFDERFPRAFREDSDIALRLIANDRRIAQGERRVTHPVRAAAALASIARQAGNADDVLMEALHGSDWYERAGAPRGAFRGHVWTVALAAVSALAGAAWLFETLRFAWRRIAPGPRTPDEIWAMLVTSFALPFAAVAHRLGGYAALPVLLATGARRASGLPRAVLIDPSWTPAAEQPADVEFAPASSLQAAALDRLRANGVAIGTLGTQCPRDGEPISAASIVNAARTLGCLARDCVVITAAGADVAAARAAGARAILVPPSPGACDDAAAGVIAATLTEAVELVLGVVRR